MADDYLRFMADENSRNCTCAKDFAAKLAGAKILTEKIIKESEYEKTQIVYLALPDGSREGPYVRKIISRDSGLGNVYKLLFNAQCNEVTSAADNTARLSDNGIPRMFYYAQNNSEIEIIEEFVDGVDLATFCADGCTENDAMEIAFSLCRSVSYLHEAFSPPIIHRDIKPENIIVCCDKLPEGLSHSACLIDFGIARAYDDTAEKDTRAFGTKGYAPPEQFGFAQTDERSDIYSLGKVLEFLFGSLSTLSSLSAKITQTACAFDPKNRFNSVNEIISILEEYKTTSETFKNANETSDSLSVCSTKQRRKAHNSDSEVVEVEATLEDSNKFNIRKPKAKVSKTPVFWIAYNIILVFAFVLLSICSGAYFFSGYTNTILDAYSKAAALEPIIGFVIVEILIFLPALILLFYKKPLYKKWPNLPRISPRTRIIIVITCIGLIMVLAFILKFIRTL